MKKEDDLKYCPFCGGRAVEVLAEGKYFFECTICESRGQKARTLEDAKKLWNDRVKPPDYYKNSQWNKHGGFFYCAKKVAAAAASAGRKLWRHSHDKTQHNTDTADRHDLAGHWCGGGVSVA